MELAFHDDLDDLCAAWVCGTFGTLRHVGFVCFKMLNLDSGGPRGKDNGGNAVCSAVAVTDAVAVAASSGLAKQESRY